MKYIKNLIFLIISFLFVSCSKSPNLVQPTLKKQIAPPQKIVEIQEKKSVTIQNEVDSIPNWILNPDKKNYICSVGSSIVKNNNYLIANKVAFITAKARISEKIKVYIESESLLIKNCDTDECKILYKTKIRQQSSNMLRNIRQLNTYKDHKNEQFYVRACIKKLIKGNNK